MVELSLGCDLQIIERSYRIGFCPKTNFACIFERVVGGVDLLGAVIVAREFVAQRLHPQLVPDTSSHLEIGTRKLAAAAVDNMVEAIIVLERICTDDVVIVRIFQTEYQSACLIDTSRDRLELDA